MSVRFEAQAEPIPGYTLLDRLGAGGFGEVWRCEAPGGIFKAVKIIHGDLRSQDNDLVRYAEQELKALKRVKQVRHPYLLALDRYDIVDGRLLIVMELADCNLWDRFREYREQGQPGIPRDELLQYMAEAAEVLDLMNDQFQLQHLDIKPQNLFLLYNHVKVADFGQVKDLQGLMAQVTGGITPVYAAPETFDGVITRYCDQYSLACVYQELLTGVRPFDGGSLSQLLMQHISLPPNLDPSPPCDRPALTRALAKRADDRWPTVTAFVRALASSGFGGGSIGSGRIGRESTVVGFAERRAEPPPPPPADTPPPGSSGDGDFLAVVSDPARPVEPPAPVFTPAPPEVTGPGPLRPALVIGLGQPGLRVLQRLRFELGERYGLPDLLPAVRSLFVDTDPETLEAATKSRSRDRLSALRPDEVFPAQLHRAGHYMKPRFNGRTLTEGWFDPQLLYKLPRNPVTLGLRVFGRLAFLDHYRALMGRVQAELEAALAPESLLLTEARTALATRTNRPRVYVVAGLSGGTGGGMFLDVAYAVRHRMRRMGYESPEIVGLFVLPPAEAGVAAPQALGNAFAALTELNHFSRADTTFTAHYDERQGVVRETEPPFTRCYLLPMPAAGVPQGAGGALGRRTPPPVGVPGARPRAGSGVTTLPGSRVVLASTSQRTPDPVATAAALKPYAEAAERIRLDLFAAVGRVADEARAAAEGDRPRAGVAVFGLATFDWPRAAVVARTARAVGHAMLKRWAVPDLRRAREVMPGLAAARWSKLGLDPDALTDRLQRAADQTAGGKVDELIGSVTEPLVPRGWLARLPEPGQVTVALDRLNKLLGPPASPTKRTPTPAEDAVAKSADAAGVAAAIDVRTLAPALADDPQFRLAGAEEMFRQFLATTDRLVERFTQSANEADAKAVAGFEKLSQYAHYQKGMSKPSAAEFTDALRQYPRARYQAVVFRQLAALYQVVREALGGRLADVSGARQQMAAVAAIEPLNPPDAPGTPRGLMPPGCPTLGEATDRFFRSLTEEDLAEVDRRVQAVLESEGGGLLQVCMNAATGLDGVVGVLIEEARAYLETRLGDVGLAGMFAERFRTAQQAERAVQQAYQEAEPAWVGPGPWAAGEVAVLACPGGDTGEPLRELARRCIPVAGLPVADSRDDLTVYREWPAVPLTALPHMGPAAAAAYRALPETTQCTPHARLDVTRWHGADD